MIHRVSGFCISLAMTVCFQGIVFPQTMEELYYTHFIASRNANPENRTGMNNFWIRQANLELQRLRSGMFDAEYEDPAGLLARLEEAMAPIYHPETELSSKEMTALWGSSEIANDVFQAMGADHCRKIVLQDLQRAMIIEIRDRGSFDNSFLSEQGFRNILELDDRQKESLDEILKRHEELLARLEREHNAGISNNANKRWEAMLGVIQPEQREIARFLIGKPVTLALDRHEDPLAKTSNAFYDNGFVYGTRFNNLLARTGREARQISDAEIEAAGIELFSPLAYMMLFSNTIHAELELSDEQRAKLKSREFLADLAERVYSRPEKGRMEQLLQGKATYPRIITEFLLPPQLEWFRQMEFQICLGAWHASTCGLTSPELIRRLGITDSQKVELEKKAAEFDGIEKGLLEAKTGAIAEAQEQMKRELLAVLNERQREKYESFFPKTAAGSRGPGVNRN